MKDITLRPATRADVPFLLDSWMKSWRKSPWAGTVRNDMYYETQRSTIECLIGRGAEFVVACLPNKPEHILGWACFEPGLEFAVIHYIYVKDPYVRHGIQRQLVDFVPGTKPGAYTHHYRQVVEACEGWRHIPEIARRREAWYRRASEIRSVLSTGQEDSGAAGSLD